MEMLLDFSTISVYLDLSIMQIKNSIQVIRMNLIRKVIENFVINMGKRKTKQGIEFWFWFQSRFSIDPVTGRANVKRREDPMKDWSEERKILEAEKLANTIDRAIR